MVPFGHSTRSLFAFFFKTFLSKTHQKQSNTNSRNNKTRQMGDTSFSGVRSVLVYPFFDANDEVDAAKRNSLEAPTIREMVGMYTECMRRANHTALVGFKDPTISSCSEDAKRRLSAYRHWGRGALPAAGPVSPPLYVVPSSSPATASAAGGASSFTTSSQSASTGGGGGFGWFGLRKLFSSSGSSSAAAAAAAPAATPAASTRAGATQTLADVLDFTKEDDEAAAAMHAKRRQAGNAGVVLTPNATAAATLERSHNAAFSEKRGLDAKPDNKKRLFVNTDEANGRDSDVRFVLWERRRTVDLTVVPWPLRERYVELLRAQGRLPEQAEEALIAIKKQVQKVE